MRFGWSNSPITFAPTNLTIAVLVAGTALWIGVARLFANVSGEIGPRVGYIMACCPDRACLCRGGAMLHRVWRWAGATTQMPFDASPKRPRCTTRSPRERRLGFRLGWLPGLGKCKARSWFDLAPRILPLATGAVAFDHCLFSVLADASLRRQERPRRIPVNLRDQSSP